VMPLAHDEPRVMDRKIRVQCGAPGPLYAVIRPENLIAIVQANPLEWLRVWMTRRKRSVAPRVPILGENHILERAGKPVDHRYDLVAARYWEGPVRHEVVLHIDNQKNILRGHGHSVASCGRSTLNFEPPTLNSL
jgi:hypothetical protein